MILLSFLNWEKLTRPHFAMPEFRVMIKKPTWIASE
jgi:hypothetical protein